MRALEDGPGSKAGLPETGPLPHVKAAQKKKPIKAPPAKPPAGPMPTGRALAWVAFAALLAHAAALGSQLFIDDRAFLELPLMQHFRTTAVLSVRLNTFLGGKGTVCLHAGNLLIHVATALAVWGLLREIATCAGRVEAEARRFALMGAALFAAHPLATEVVNYVRARDTSLMLLFSVLAGTAFLQSNTRPHRLVWAGVFALVALNAKPHAVLVTPCLLLVLGLWQRSRWFRFRLWGWALIPAGLLLAFLAAIHHTYVARFFESISRLHALAYFTYGHLKVFTHQAANAFNATADNPLPWHLLTQVKVFGYFVERLLVPLRLCNDHHIPTSTRLADPAVLWGALLFLALGAAAVWGLRRRSVSGLMLAVIVTQLGLYFLYLSGEVMVEYRAYPALVGFCGLVAWAALRLKPQHALWATAGLAAVYATLSERRAIQWHDHDTLIRDVIARYPLNTRALGDVVFGHFVAGRYEEAEAAAFQNRVALRDILLKNQADPYGRRYSEYQAYFFTISSEGVRARTVAKARGKEAGKRELADLERRIRSLGNPPREFWSLFYYHAGRLHAEAGDVAEAVRLMRNGYPFPSLEMTLDLAQMEAYLKRDHELEGSRVGAGAASGADH